MSDRVKLIIHQDRLWRSAKARREFEVECGFEPLGLPQSPEWYAKRDSGELEAYERSFMAWSRQRAIAMEAAAAGETEGLDPKGDSAVAKPIAPPATPL